MTLAIRYRASIEAYEHLNGQSADQDRCLCVVFEQDCASQEEARAVIDKVFNDLDSMRKITRRFSPSYYRATVALIGCTDAFVQPTEEYL